MPADLEARAVQSARETLKTRLAELGTDTATIDIQTGIPFLEIIQAARAGNFDLVVVGAHGRSYLHDLVLGTTAERVVRKGQMPVLIVKFPAAEAYRRFLVPTDFSQGAQRALASARRLAPQARAALLHVYDLSFELRAWEIGSERLLDLQRAYEPDLRAKLKSLATEAGIDSETTEFDVRYGYPARVIAAAVRDGHADLVAVGTRGAQDLRYVLLGSVAEHVLREAPADVLTVPPASTVFELP